MSPLVARLRNLQLAIDGADQTGILDDRQIEGVRSGLVELARLARVTGLSTHCSLSLQVLEQLAPIMKANYLPVGVMSVFRAWIVLSNKYLGNPCYSSKLIENLGDRRWEHPVQKAYRGILLGGLKRDWANIESEQTRRWRSNAFDIVSSRSENDALR